MRNLLLTAAASCALFAGSLAATDTAEARPWRRVWRAPAVRVYAGYRPYYGYRSYYRPYYGYRSYYSPYYGYGSYYRPYRYSYGYPYYTARPFYGGGVYIGF